MDADGDMVIVQNPTLAPAIEKSDYEPKTPEADASVDADTVNDATSFLETFFKLYQTATEKELAYYVSGNVLEPIGRDYFYSELVNPVFTKDGDNVKVNEYYWLIKHFDDTTLEHIRNRFDKESGMDFMHRFNQLNDKVIRLKEKNIAPEDKQAQALAQEFWNMVMEFTNGDMSMLPTLMKFDNLIGDNNEWLKKQKQVNEYLQPALELYFQNAGINAFEGV